MSDSLGFNVKITGDATNFEKSINDATAAIENQSKKATKALKDQRDAYGVLRDEQGRIVEGLSKWQRALGYYVDELGTVRTANDRFIDGLTTVQKKIGMEVDELGNIYDRAGKIVGNTGKGLKDFSDAERQAAAGANDLQAALEAAINNTLGDSVAKMQRDLLDLSGAFSKVKGGFDALLGGNNALSKAVDNIGKVSQAIVGFKQAGESIQQALNTVKGFTGALSQAGAAGAKSTGAVTSGFASITGAANGASAAATAAGTSIASLATGIGLAIAGASLLDSVMQKLSGGVVFDAEKQKAIADYSEQFKTLEARARNAGIEIKNLSDALRIGALSTNAGGTELDQLLADYKETLQTGLSSYARERIEQETNIFGDTLTKGLVKALSWLPGGDTEKVKQERAAVFAAINARVKEVVDKQKSESDLIMEQIHDLDHAINLLDDEEQKNQVRQASAKLLEAYNQAREKEEKAARQEVRRNAGLDKYIKAQEDAEVSLDNARAKFAEWFNMAQSGAIEWREYYEATANATEEMRAAVSSKTGAALENSQKKAVETYNDLRKAVAQGVISANEANEAWRSFQERAAAEIAQKFNLTLDNTDAPKLDDLQKEIERQIKAGAINQQEADKLIDAFKKRAAQELAAAQGIDIEAETKLENSKKTAAQKLDEWRKKLDAGEITQDQYNRAAAALARAQRDRAAQLAKETGVDLPGEKNNQKGASAIADRLREQQKKWAEALQAGDVTQEQYNAAIKQLTEQARTSYEEQRDALDERKKAQVEYNKRLKELADLAAAGVISEKERRDEEKRARDKYKESQKKVDPAAASALESLRAQEKQTTQQKSWQDELKAQVDAVKEAQKKGLATQAEVHEAEALYAKIKRRRAKQEEAEAARAARDAARSELGIDSIMEGLKSPLQKFNETIGKLNDAAQYLSMEEYAAVYNNALKDLIEANKTAAESVGESKGEKATAGASITAGSDSFYKALVDSMAPGNYESTMKDTTKRIADTAAQGNLLAQDSNALLMQIAQAVQTNNFGGNIAVFGG